MALSCQKNALFCFLFSLLSSCETTSSVSTGPDEESKQGNILWNDRRNGKQIENDICKSTLDFSYNQLSWNSEKRGPLKDHLKKFEKCIQKMYLNIEGRDDLEKEDCKVIAESPINGINLKETNADMACLTELAKSPSLTQIKLGYERHFKGNRLLSDTAVQQLAPLQLETFELTDHLEIFTDAAITPLNLKKATSVVLNANNLTGNALANSHEWNSLKKLQLWGSKFDSNSLQYASSWGQLTHLNLYGKNLTEALAQHGEQLSSLEEVSLHNMKDIALVGSHKWKQLKVLQLYSEEFTFEALKFIDAPLKVLKLHGNKFDSNQLAIIPALDLKKRCSQLEKIELSGDHFTDQLLQYAEEAKIIELELWGKQFTDQVLRYGKKWKLQSLSLHGDNFTENAVKIANQQWPALRFFYTSGAQFKKDGFRI
ncbi:hypothetical protein [Pajaroellobacter abortibovis]|uniref:Uncharacterized protein n=1 Tax=Pajaroellobacter abortibovis TaxID=1882918 RepID=A0A1L6MX78_9BACT|nr:hypothetical protein [Pajaroellobacter abortibovis]APS00056.1 hypothetical protein BCY86_04700 [Pajaroellobacter abortibovis]